jgi:HYDIN/CFA65/VesB family protein
MKTSLTRSVLGALALATLLVAPLGCAGVDESGEAVGEAVEALNTPVLVANPSSLAFGTILHGTSSTLAVTLTNTGTVAASAITVALPPDPYRVIHDPPGNLPAGARSSLMQVAFAPSKLGTFSTTIVVNYHDEAGTLYTLNLPVTGTAN